jgi:hypothetical protein
MKQHFVVVALVLACAATLIGCPPAGPKIGLSATSHHFEPGETTWSFEVSNVGSPASTLVFSVSAVPGWINVTPTAGTITGNEDMVTVVVTVNADPALKADFNTGEVRVQDNNETRIIAISAAPNYLTQEFTSSNFDLAFRMITFVPAPGLTASYYVAGTEPTAAFPVDPTGGVDLGPFFLEDDPVAMSPFLNKQVWLYGKNYNTFYVGSDGYVSFRKPVSMLISLADHFAIPRISGLFTNLDPAAGGTISAVQTADAVAVTFEDVPVAGTLNSNTFQIVMYFDGVIQIAYLDMDAGNGIAGLSFGEGLPDDFVNSDLSNFNTASIAILLP